MSIRECPCFEFYCDDQEENMALNKIIIDKSIENGCLHCEDVYNCEYYRERMECE